MLRTWIWAICIGLVSCSPPSPLPDMQAGETGRVTKIIDGDGLILDSGQRVRLISITAPVLSPRDGLPEAYSGESARILEDLALGRRVRLFYPGLTRDKYDRALAHVVTIDAAGSPIWLNQAMLKHGAARVRLYGSTSARGQDLLKIESDARAAHRGLWALPTYQTQPVELLGSDARGFVILSGTLTETIAADPDQKYPPACLRQFSDAALVLRVDRSARSTCGLSAGTIIEVRGWLSDQELSLRHPWHVTVTPER